MTRPWETVADMSEEDFWRGIRFLAIVSVVLILIGWATSR